jgi:hypothetical protein
VCVCVWKKSTLTRHACDAIPAGLAIARIYLVEALCGHRFVAAVAVAIDSCIHWHITIGGARASVLENVCKERSWAREGCWVS